MKFLIKNENDVKIYNPPIFLKIIIIQEHKFSMLVSHKIFIIKYFNFQNPNEKGEDCGGGFFFPFSIEHLTQYDTLWLLKNYTL
jgi:hypothetical protein